MRRSTARLTIDGRPADWLGANFWSRAGGPLMWRNYDPAVIDEELATLAGHGLTMTRSFFYWPDFMPAPDQVDETLAARFTDFLDRHEAHKLATVPTFIVGHMSGENWDPAWRAGVGRDHQERGPRGRRPPAVLPRRRRLGDRGARPRQRLPAHRHRPAR